MRSPIAPVSVSLQIAMVLLVGGNAETSAQAVFGRTLDKQSLEPVPLVQVLLIANGDTLRAVSDHRGNYIFAEAVAGRYVLIAERIGYERVVTPTFGIEAKEGLRLDISLT